MQLPGEVSKLRKAWCRVTFFPIPKLSTTNSEPTSQLIPSVARLINSPTKHRRSDRNFDNLTHERTRQYEFLAFYNGEELAYMFRRY